jgi:hypothetical protein
MSKCNANKTDNNGNSDLAFLKKVVLNTGIVSIVAGITLVAGLAYIKASKERNDPFINAVVKDYEKLSEGNPSNLDTINPKTYQTAIKNNCDKLQAPVIPGEIATVLAKKHGSDISRLPKFADVGTDYCGKGFFK